MAGSERVLVHLYALFPEAPIYTSVYAPAQMPPVFRQMDIRPSFLQRWPGAKRHWRRYLLLMPLAFESFDLSGYEVVISNSHACAKGVLTRPETCHICYCYTPMRYVWDFYPTYLRSEEIGKAVRQVLPLVLHYLRLWDYCAAQRPDVLVAISRHVQRRIKKHYRREARVIYPPVEVSSFWPAEPVEREDYFLVVSRFVGYKRVDLALEAFNRLRLPLRVVGYGPEERQLRRLAGETVEFLGWQPDETVRDLYRRARALIFPGEEDFGLTPVEAMAAGTPVIAYARGGACETVVEGVTGLFFREQTPEALMEAVERFSQCEFDPSTLHRHALKFDRTVFQEAMQQLVQQSWEAHQLTVNQ